jgi:hypothetical protein
VRFYDGDGKTLTEKVLKDGESYTVPADAHDPKLRTGHPELLTITIGGQSVPKLSEEMKTVKDVPVTAAALNARGNAAPPAQPSGQASPVPSAQPSGQPAPQPSSTPAATPAASPSPSASAAVHHTPRPRRHKTRGETVTSGGVLPAGVPLVTNRLQPREIPDLFAVTALRYPQLRQGIPAQSGASCRGAARQEPRP